MKKVIVTLILLVTFLQSNAQNNWTWTVIKEDIWATYLCSTPNFLYYSLLPYNVEKTDGENFFPVYSPGTLHITSKYFENDSVGYCYASAGTMYVTKHFLKTSNGGLNWTISQISGGSIYSDYQLKKIQNWYYLVGQNPAYVFENGLKKSLDGINWISDTPGGDITGIAEGYDGIYVSSVYIRGDDNGDSLFLMKKNFNGSWYKLDILPSISYRPYQNISSHIINDGKYLVLMGGGRKLVKYREDTQELSYSIFPKNIVKVVLKTDQVGFVLCNENGGQIYRTSNGGSNWDLIGDFSQNPIGDMSVLRDELIITLLYPSYGDDKIYRGMMDVPLPIELSSFTSVININNVTLNWTTASETNNSEFQVERKFDGAWETIGYVEGHGTTSMPHTYQFIDTNIQSGKYSYRLMQIDFNGNYEYHNLNNEVFIGIPEKFKLKQNYPNPFNPKTIIEYTVPYSGMVTLIVYDINGKEISNLVKESKQAGYYSVDFDGSNLSSGIYYYRLIVGGYNETKKMMLIK